MECPKCKSTKVVKNGTKGGKQRYICRNPECSVKEFSEKSQLIKTQTKKPTNGIGTPLNQWKEKYDVDFIVQKVMENLSTDMMYEKSDVYKLTGLSPSYPGLSAAIDSYTDYYGKAGGRQHFSHPDTIQHYKRKGRLT